jgi:Cu/Ag efflux protein CusF
VISVDPRKGRVVLDHKEIRGFMAAMTSMSFLVTPPSLLEGLHPGEAIRFTIDADQRVIVDIAPVPALPAPAQQR